jgi:hypothetical protein
LDSKYRKATTRAKKERKVTLKDVSREFIEEIERFKRNYELETGRRLSDREASRLFVASARNQPVFIISRKRNKYSRFKLL